MRRAFAGLLLFAAAHATAARVSDASGQIDAEHMASVDRMIAAMNFPSVFEATVRMQVEFHASLPKDDYSPAEIEYQRLMSLAVSRIAWRPVADRWRHLFASEMSKQQIDAVVAFYETDAGRALAGCFGDGKSLAKMNDCGIAVVGRHPEIERFQGGEASSLSESIMMREMPKILEEGIRMQLEGDADLKTRVGDVCAQVGTGALCNALYPADGEDSQGL